MRHITACLFAGTVFLALSGMVAAGSAAQSQALSTALQEKRKLDSGVERRPIAPPTYLARTYDPFMKGAAKILGSGRFGRVECEEAFNMRKKWRSINCYASWHPGASRLGAFFLLGEADGRVSRASLNIAKWSFKSGYPGKLERMNERQLAQARLLQQLFLEVFIRCETDEKKVGFVSLLMDAWKDTPEDYAESKDSKIHKAEATCALTIGARVVGYIPPKDPYVFDSLSLSFLPQGKEDIQ